MRSLRFQIIFCLFTGHWAQAQPEWTIYYPVINWKLLRCNSLAKIYIFSESGSEDNSHGKKSFSFACYSYKRVRSQFECAFCVNFLLAIKFKHNYQYRDMKNKSRNLILKSNKKVKKTTSSFLREILLNELLFMLSCAE